MLLNMTHFNEYIKNESRNYIMVDFCDPFHQNNKALLCKSVIIVITVYLQ